MIDRWRIGIEGKESLYVKEWGVESRNYPVSSWYANSKTWREIEDNKVGDKKLLVARNDKKCGEIYRWIWYVLENKEPYRSTGREADDK